VLRAASPVARSQPVARSRGPHTVDLTETGHSWETTAASPPP
jgi:hypothetical protein